MGVIKSQFDVGARVNVDGCKGLVGTITAVQWRTPDLITYEVSWIVNGDSKSVLIEEWRLGVCDAN